MPTSTVTKDDLIKFKIELLDGIKELLNDQAGHKSKKWLKSRDVIQLLKLSPKTLRNLRVKGELPYIKIGGLIYYESLDIEKVISSNKVQTFK